MNKLKKKKRETDREEEDVLKGYKSSNISSNIILNFH